MKNIEVFFALISFFILAPLCPKPPDAPNEGVQEHLPIPIGLEPQQNCVLDSEQVILTCPSFLRTYITEISYGRDSSTGRELCAGEKPDDAKPLSFGTCYDEDFNNQLLLDMAYECHGMFNCTFTVPTVPLSLACDGLRREVKINHTCGKF